MCVSVSVSFRPTRDTAKFPSAIFEGLIGNLCVNGAYSLSIRFSFRFQNFTKQAYRIVLAMTFAHRFCVVCTSIVLLLFLLLLVLLFGCA